MQIRPVCTELHIGKPLHILQRHERAECATIRSYARAYDFHEIRFGPFPELAARSEVRRRRGASARTLEIFTVTSATSACVDEILSVFD